MASKTNPRQQARLKRKKRIRKKISGNPERPRLSVFRSSKHIYAQLIDDDNAVTLVAVSTLHPDVRQQEKVKGKIEDAKRVGKMIADQAKCELLPRRPGKQDWSFELAFSRQLSALSGLEKS